MESAETQRQLSLLLVDDDVELCGMMMEFFAQTSHHLDCAHNGRDGLALALDGAYDLMILDVMLPARVQRHDRIRGLNTGADDYLPKPFDPDELLARINAVLRRTRTANMNASAVVTIGDIQVNPTTREVSVAGSPVELTPLEFDLLQMLMRSVGRVVSREEITLALFEREATPYDRFLDVHVSHLRKKLEGGRKLIRAVRGVGYVFTGTV
jgi:two-component system response regulator CpxR